MTVIIPRHPIETVFTVKRSFTRIVLLSRHLIDTGTECKRSFTMKFRFSFFITISCAPTLIQFSGKICVKTNFRKNLFFIFQVWFMFIIPVYTHWYTIFHRYFCVPSLLLKNYIENFLRLRLSCIVVNFSRSTFSRSASSRLASKTMFLSNFMPNAFREVPRADPQWPWINGFRRISSTWEKTPKMRLSFLLNSLDSFFVILTSISSKTWVIQYFRDLETFVVCARLLLGCSSKNSLLRMLVFADSSGLPVSMGT